MNMHLAPLFKRVAMHCPLFSLMPDPAPTAGRKGDGAAGPVCRPDTEPALSTGRCGGWRSRTGALLLTLLLVLAVGQWALITTVKTPAFDEPMDIAGGLLNLYAGDYRYVPEHPPLPRQLFAAAVGFRPFFMPPPTISREDANELIAYANTVFYRSGNDHPGMLRRARIPSLLAWLLIILTGYAWARRDLGEKSAVLYAVATVCSPALCAGAATAGADIFLAAFTLASAYALRCYAATRAPLAFVLAAAFAGLAAASKLTAVVYLFLLVAGWAAIAVGRRERGAARRLAPPALFVLLATLTVWGCYRGETGRFLAHVERDWCALRELPQPALQVLLAQDRYLRVIPMPDFFAGLLQLFLHTRLEHAGFFWGDNITTAPWFYWPVVLLLKTPLPVLLFLAWRVVLLRRRDWPDDRFFLVPAAVIFLVGLTIRLPNGVRYLLPLYPLLHLFLAGLARNAGGVIRRWLTLALMSVVLMLPLLFTLPHADAFANSLAGGVTGLHRYLCLNDVDSGQDLQLLRDYLRAVPPGEEPFSLAYFGSVEPGFYGVDLPPIPETAIFRRQPGNYVVSVTCLQGLTDGRPGAYAWFWQEETAGTIGGSMKVYRIR